MVGLAHLFDRACVESMSFTAAGTSLEELVAHVVTVLATDLALEWSRNQVGCWLYFRFLSIFWLFAIKGIVSTSPPRLCFAVCTGLYLA